MRLDRSLLSALLVAALGCEAAPIDDDFYVAETAAPTCRPNNDGIITADELILVQGVRSRFRVTDGPVDVDIEGKNEGGVTVWDLTRPDPSADPVALLGLEAMGAQWFEEEFEAAADGAAPLDAAASNLGPVAADDDGIVLFGFASREENPDEGQTLAVFDVPVRLYALPLSLGATWSSHVEADNAKLLGLPTAFEDDYTMTVVAQGKVILPDVILENTLLVRIDLERTLLAGDLRSRSYSFVHECLGEVARAEVEAVPLSQAIPDNPTISQLRRLSL